MKLLVIPYGSHFSIFDLYLERSNLKNDKSTLTHVVQRTTVRNSITHERKKTIDYRWVGWYILKCSRPVHFEVPHDKFINGVKSI